MRWVTRHAGQTAEWGRAAIEPGAGDKSPISIPALNSEVDNSLHRTNLGALWPQTRPLDQQDLPSQPRVTDSLCL